MTQHSTWRRAGAASFALAAAALATYPALRPYADEHTLAGAEAWASSAWVWSHALGMVGFIALAAGARALWRLRPSTDARAAGLAAGAMWFGVSLILPYYGAETFGLTVIGERAVATGDESMVALAETFRYGAVPLAFFTVGLLSIALAGVALAVALRRSPGAVRLGATLVATALVLYLPQFFLAPALRMAHGALLAVGCLVLAAQMWRGRLAASDARGRGTVGAAGIEPATTSL